MPVKNSRRKLMDLMDFNQRSLWTLLFYRNVCKFRTDNDFKDALHILCLPQESYVWKMYQERCWEFFPVGDCFRKQYEDQLG